MNLKIKQITNGYIIFYKQENIEGNFIEIQEVFEETDDEKEVMTRLLYRVARYFGMDYDKFGKDNLSIKWDLKGTKV